MAVQTLSFGSQEADRRLNRLLSTSQRVLVMNFGAEAELKAADRDHWFGLIGLFKLCFHSVSVYLHNNHRDPGEGNRRFRM